MDIWSFYWGVRPDWAEYVFYLESGFVGLFLLVLTGVVFTQYHRRPRAAKFFLAAIGLSLGNWWVLPLVSTFGSFLAYFLSSTINPIMVSFGAELVESLVSVAVMGTVWWLLIVAAFSRPPVPPELDLAEPADGL